MWHDVTNYNRSTAVTPVVSYFGAVDLDKDVRVNADEVAEVFSVPLRDLVDPALQSTTTFETRSLSMPQFDGGPHRIWGLTAYVLSGCLHDALFPPAEAQPPPNPKL